MTITRPRKKKRLKQIILLPVLLLLIVFTAVVTVVYMNQDEIVKGQIEALNESHAGLISIADTHLAPFKDFPYISLKVDSVKIMETKAKDAAVILDVADIYLGFQLWDIIGGNFDIQSLVVDDGFFNLVFHEDGTTNIQNALAAPDDVEESEPLNIHLKKIKLNNLDIHKLNESSHTDIETYV